MKVLFLCKRHSTGKDSLEDRYGRLFQLPAGLAELGAEVQVLSLSYRLAPRESEVSLAPNFKWQDFSLTPRGLGAYFRVIRAMRSEPPDVVYSSSDALQIALGDRVARNLAVPHVADLYDDYEAFGLTRFPGLKSALRRACIRADQLTVVSQSLREIVSRRGALMTRIHHLPNGVETAVQRVSRTALLARLNIPPSARLVGAVGALDESRGITDLFDAFGRLENDHPDLHLVLVGKETGRTLSRRGQRIHRLGSLSHADALDVVGALDVAVVCNRDGAFARACHPMKLVEAISMSVPVVAAAVGEVRRLLESRPDSLYPPGDSAVLASRIASHLATPRPLDPSLARTWGEICVDLHEILHRASEDHRR